MLLWIYKRLTVTNIALALTVVFAMSGAAYAAGKFVITSTKQIKPSVLKQLKGNAGAVGSQGPVGAQGIPGKDGAQGQEGKQGPQGPQGPAGPEGKQGSPWTVGSVLPEGQTEKGVWAVGGIASAAKQIATSPISFGIPLKTAPATQFIGPEQGEGEPAELKPFPAGCKGTPEDPATVANPVAQPGHLCVYAHQEFNSKLYLGVGFVNTEAGGIGSGKAGTVLFMEAEEEGKFVADGVWAVTAE
jgi:collagen triple helix repeat protein